MFLQIHKEFRWDYGDLDQLQQSKWSRTVLMPCLTVGPSSPTPSLANGYVRSLFGQCCMWRAFLVLISLAAQSGSSELDSRFFIHPFHWNLDDYFGTMWSILLPISQESFYELTHLCIVLVYNLVFQENWEKAPPEFGYQLTKIGENTLILSKNEPWGGEGGCYTFTPLLSRYIDCW